MIRRTELSDMPVILDIYDKARCFMRANGNMNQWVNGYPDEEVLKQDIENGISRVCEQEGRPYAVFAFIPWEDITYRVIYDGAWLNACPYAAVHRVASDGTHHGVLHEIVEYCLASGLDLRIDTHRDNLVMQHQLEKCGFIRCGIIHLLNGDERIAYQKRNR